MARQPLWQSDEVARSIGAPPAGEWSADGVSIDSRTVDPRDIFVALRGPSFDGHDFVAGAFREGAAAAVVSRRPEGLPADAPLLVVEDTMEALNALGRAAVARSAARIVAITGSVGKTGTKEALRECLGRQGSTTANVGNLNNHIGVPLSLARMPRDADYGVFELGMSNPGEIAHLSRLVRPHVAIVTTIAAVHQAAFDSVYAIAEEKGGIFEGMDADGVAILNRDNAYFPVLADMARRRGLAQVIGFGAHPEATARLMDCEVGDSATMVSAVIGGSAISYRIGLSGRHHAVNSLAVLAAVQAVGADIGTAAVALADIAPQDGRGRRHGVAIEGGFVTLIDDSYNASPVSMRAALATLGSARPGRRGRRIAVLGDMLELGPDSARYHAQLAGPVADNAIDLVFTAGPDMARLHDALPEDLRGGHAPESASLAPVVVASLRNGDVVLVKGSHGSRMDLVVDAILSASGAARVANGG